MDRRHWVLVSRHMIHSDEVSQSSKPVSLLTANGVFQATDQARVNVPVLGTDINPYVLEDSPAAVSYTHLTLPTKLEV